MLPNGRTTHSQTVVGNLKDDIKSKHSSFIRRKAL